MYEQKKQHLHLNFELIIYQITGSKWCDLVKSCGVYIMFIVWTPSIYFDWNLNHPRILSKKSSAYDVSLGIIVYYRGRCDQFVNHTHAHLHTPKQKFRHFFR